LALVVVAAIGPGLQNSIVAISLVSLPSIARTLRAGVLVEKNKNYVWASKHFGSSWIRTFVFGVLPNCTAPLIVQLTFAFGSGILNAAALGFLGLGAQPPVPEWGTMLADGRIFMESASWLVIYPGICLFITVLGVNLFGDGLRQWLLSPRRSS
jgi:ABC-type dipeptide/oligopeptide/nickel transport system permease subunit